MQNDKNQKLIYLYDLPKDKCTSTFIAELIKGITNEKITTQP